MHVCMAWLVTCGRPLAHRKEVCFSCPALKGPDAPGVPSLFVVISPPLTTAEPTARMVALRGDATPGGVPLRPPLVGRYAS